MYFEEHDWVIIDRVVELAAKLKVPPAQLALAWILHKPGVNSPIIGCTKSSHLDDAVAALKIKLTSEHMNFLEEAYKPHLVLGTNAPLRTPTTATPKKE